MTKYLILLWILTITTFGQTWRDIYPMPAIPAKTKDFKDYSVQDVWRCAIDEKTEDLFPEDHPFLEKGMAGIKENWAEAKNPQKAKEMIQLAINTAQEYAKNKEESIPASWFKNSLSAKQQTLIDLSKVLKEAFDLTSEQKREALLTLAKNEIDQEKKLLLVYTSLLVARDTLDVELLKYSSDFMQEPRVAIKFRTKYEGEDRSKLYIERSYGRILSGEIQNVVDLIQNGELKNNSPLPLLSEAASKELQNWISNNWETLETKSQERKGE